MFDHSTQGAYAVAAGVSRALALDQDQTANAIGVCGATFNVLRVIRTGALSRRTLSGPSADWAGAAFPGPRRGMIQE